MLEVNITVFGSYLLFYMSQDTILDVSGILALVAMGLYMTNKGKYRISKESEEAVHHVWSYLAFIAETTIFLLAGLIIGIKTLTSSHITYKDYLLCLALYVFLHLIRFVSILIFWPCLRKMGYGLTFKQVVLLSYGGLRGALGLTLGLIVANEEGEKNEYAKALILFHTAGIALVTIIINGTTTGFLIRKLGLSKVTTPLKMKLMDNLIDQVTDEVEKLIESLK